MKMSKLHVAGLFFWLIACVAVEPLVEWLL